MVLAVSAFLLIRTSMAVMVELLGIDEKSKPLARMCWQEVGREYCIVMLAPASFSELTPVASPPDVANDQPI